MTRNEFITNQIGGEYIAMIDSENYDFEFSFALERAEAIAKELEHENLAPWQETPK